MKAERERESAGWLTRSLARPPARDSSGCFRPNGSLSSRRQEMKAAGARSPCSWIAFNFWPKMVVIRTRLWADLRSAHPSPSCQRLESNYQPPFHLQSKAAYGRRRMDGSRGQEAHASLHNRLDARVISSDLSFSSNRIDFAFLTDKCQICHIFKKF